MRSRSPAYTDPVGTRLRFFDGLCDGLTVTQAAARVGICRNTGHQWGIRSGVTNLIRTGRFGGIDRKYLDAGPVGTGRRLCLRERMIIQEMLAAGSSLRQIAARLRRCPSTISREVRAHTTPVGVYHGVLAHVQAHQSARRPKAYKLFDRGLCETVEAYIDDGWSPKLIADVIRRDHPEDRSWWISHETIYQALYVQARGRLRQDLARCLSTHRRSRKPRGREETRGNPYRQALTISQRPAEVADRAVPGHWEGDLIIGSGQSAIGTLVERQTRFTILLHLPGTVSADAVAAAMIGQMNRLPDHLRRSITWDRGRELARFVRVQLELQAPVYFCDPHSPWQRGTNENTNRLLRHWFAKGSDLSAWSADELDRVAATLNKRPRPSLDYKTPQQALNELLANPPTTVATTT